MATHSKCTAGLQSFEGTLACFTNGCSVHSFTSCSSAVLKASRLRVSCGIVMQRQPNFHTRPCSRRLRVGMCQDNIVSANAHLRLLQVVPQRP